ncbi:hypothetical protein Pmar_PMAR014507 [Perkinsus marinus ATCC 50983]|uniref:CST complex subunit CTC1 n=1 Tax=Perkinsus marinus (strain ATCC 50983 / TXsc) TaxID=423536 RepID=C5KW98_PERM5|nr:hypothetical protein Pmar_PMAR014507 [Perkinsus marinus ATCC 50983]EER11209.1 hypothetical protein Pmar_PMAR014507 [Perkinsus marinus ATCC 50983]|eukprot:XP_002779414.1 hypothetical protein Pmar_PMAR014507 [Perkinsus marinus ATCC 50983]
MTGSVAVVDITIDPDSMRPKAGEQYIQLVGLSKQSLQSGWSLPVLNRVQDVTFVDAESIMMPTDAPAGAQASISGTVLALSCILRPRGGASSVVWVLHFADDEVPVAFKGANNIINRSCLCPGSSVEIVGVLKKGSAPVSGRRCEIRLADSAVSIRRLSEGHPGLRIKITYVLAGAAILGACSDVHEGCPLHAVRALCRSLDPQVDTRIAHSEPCTNPALVLGYSSILTRPEMVRPVCHGPSIVFRELPSCWHRQIFECARNMMLGEPFSVASAPRADSVAVYNLASGLHCRNSLGVHVGGPMVVANSDPPAALTDKRGIVVRCAKGVCYFQCPDGTLGHSKGDLRSALSVIGKLSDREEKLALSHASSLHPVLYSVGEVSRLSPSTPFTLKAVVLCEISHRNLSRAPDVLLASVNAEGWDVAIQDMAPKGQLLRMWISRTQLRRELPVPSLVDISDVIVLVNDYVPERHTIGPFRPVFSVLLPTGFIELRWPRLPPSIVPHALPDNFWVTGRVSWLREVNAFATCCECGEKIYLLSACSCSRVRVLSAEDLSLDDLDVSFVAKGEIVSDMGFCMQAVFVGEAALAVCADSPITGSLSDGIKRFIIADGGGTAMLASRESRESKWEPQYAGFTYPERVSGRFRFSGERQEDGLHLDQARLLEESQGGINARLEMHVFRNLEKME